MREQVFKASYVRNQIQGSSKGFCGDLDHKLTKNENTKLKIKFATSLKFKVSGIQVGLQINHISHIKIKTSNHCDNLKDTKIIRNLILAAVIPFNFMYLYCCVSIKGR